jgi:hypothetical protein
MSSSADVLQQSAKMGEQDAESLKKSEALFKIVQKRCREPRPEWEENEAVAKIKNLYPLQCVKLDDDCKPGEILNPPDTVSIWGEPQIETEKRRVGNLPKDVQQALYTWMHEALNLRIYK